MRLRLGRTLAADADREMNPNSVSARSESVLGASRRPDPAPARTRMPHRLVMINRRPVSCRGPKGGRPGVGAVAGGARRLAANAAAGRACRCVTRVVAVMAFEPSQAIPK